MNNQKILITGSSGTGKSAVQKELVKRGFNALDADARELKLCSWFDVETGRNLGRGLPNDFSVDKYDWRWDGAVLNEILSPQGAVFVCGNANNAPDYYSVFDLIFVLNTDEAEHRRRINVRTEHDFAKDDDTQSRVIKRQQELVDFATSIGAIIVDATPPPDQVVDSILKISQQKPADKGVV